MPIPSRSLLMSTGVHVTLLASVVFLPAYAGSRTRPATVRFELRQPAPLATPTEVREVAEAERATTEVPLREPHI